MDIMTFRAYKYKMLASKPKVVQEVSDRRVLLGSQTMSIECLALIISHVEVEYTKDNGDIK